VIVWQQFDAQRAAGPAGCGGLLELAASSAGAAAAQAGG